MDLEEGVILVVGAETEYKTRVADALAEGRGATEVETTKGGVRNFRRMSSPEAVVIETTPLNVSWSLEPAAEAAKWISQNALRKLFGKLISVVCVVTSSGPNDPLHQVDETWSEKTFTWLNLLGYIFKEHQQAIMVLVKLAGTGTSGCSCEQATLAGVIDALERDGFARNQISFETMEREDLLPAVRSVLERSVGHGGKAKYRVQTMAYFHLKEVTEKSRVVDRYGHWGPERVILIGRTGSGKSTLSEMLTKGRLDPSHTPAGSGIRGKTKDIRHVEGRGWYVVDTPGFGELKDELSTISTEDAEKILKRYVHSIEGTYSHFIYVVMKDRIDLLETRVWEFFKLLFSADSTKAGWIERTFTAEFNVQKNFTVVVSNATPEWVESNLSTLKANFDGCDSFLSYEFPPTETGDEELETELSEVRTESLKQLEEELESLSRFPYYCQFGLYSKSTIGTIASDMASWRRSELKGLDRALCWAEAKLAKGVFSFERLLSMLTVDDGIVLMPLFADNCK